MNGRRNNRVKFEDDISYTNASSNYYNAANTAPVASVESSASSYRYNGPRFPNLQMIFKKRSTSLDEEARKEEAPAAATVTAVHRDDVVDQSSSAERDTVTRTRGLDMDVNSEAADFIKRKHKSLELQKLMSIKAAAA